MRVTVTGGTGFLGSYVHQEAVARGHEVAALSSEDFDLRTAYGVRGAIYSTHPDAVIHVAAFVGGIGLNVAQPGRMFYDNMMMGVNLIEQARLSGVERFVTIGTGCSYPSNLLPPQQEDRIWDGYPPRATASYAVAKRALLEMGQAYRTQYGMQVEHVIPTNLYGPRDHFDEENGHVMAAMISKVSRAVRDDDDEVVFWGTGIPTRDFLHVRDAARGIVAALETDSNTEGRPINLASGRETPIHELARLVTEAYSFEGEVTWDVTRPDGQLRRYLSIDRARFLLDWQPEVSLEEGVRETVDWYEKER